MKRADCLAALYPELGDRLVVTIMGATAQELYDLGHRETFFYLQHAMGLASSIGLGLALNRPEARVVVLDGDGSVLMNLGGLATLGRYRPSNLTHIVFDNGSLLSTGGFVSHTASGRTVSRRDRHHEEADAFFRGAVAQRTHLVTTVVVLAEVHRLLLFRAGIAPAAAALARIEANPLVALEFVNGDHHRATRVWLERLADQPITYTDAMSFAVMEALRCRVALAFDHHFEVAGFTRWQRPP